MERKLFGLFSGAQLTAIIGFLTLAVAVPSGVWAVSFTYNALYNPTNGQTAAIDATRRLWVRESVLEQSQVPANFVHVLISATSGCNGSGYTIPAGKALIVQGVTGFLFPGSTDRGEEDLYTSNDCNSGFFGALVDGSGTPESQNQTFGSGVPVPSGQQLSVYGVNAGGSVMVYGYLVPANQVPAGVPSVTGAKPTPGRSPTMSRKG